MSVDSSKKGKNLIVITLVVFFRKGDNCEVSLSRKGKKRILSAAKGTSKGGGAARKLREDPRKRGGDPPFSGRGKEGGKHFQRKIISLGLKESTISERKYKL